MRYVASVAIICKKLTLVNNSFLLIIHREQANVTIVSSVQLLTSL